MYNLKHLGLYKNIPKKRMFNPVPDYDRDAYTLLQYKSRLRNEFLIPLKANGNGSGVATIRLQSLETQTVKITGNGKFYTDSAGTTVQGAESSIDTSLTSLYVKVPVGESCYLVLSKADKLSGLGDRFNPCITEVTNAPIINGCKIAYKLTSLEYIRFDNVVNSFLLGSIDNTSNLTYLDLQNNPLTALTGSIDNTLRLGFIRVSNNPLTALTGSIDNTTDLTYLNLQNTPLMALTGSVDNTTGLTTLNLQNTPLTALTGDIGLLEKCHYFNFTNNTASQLTYITSRNTIAKWPSGRFRLIVVSMASMTSAMCDSLLIDIDASGVMPVNEGLINLNGLCGAVTSASETARTSLVNKGFIVIVNT